MSNIYTLDKKGKFLILLDEILEKKSDFNINEERTV